MQIIGCRNAALLTLGFGAAMRRSELVGLDWQELGTGTGLGQPQPLPVFEREAVEHAGGEDELQIRSVFVSERGGPIEAASSSQSSSSIRSAHWIGMKQLHG